MTLSIATIAGPVPLEVDFEDLEDAESRPVDTLPDLTPAVLRLISQSVAAERERAAARLDSYADCDVLIPTSRAAAIVRGGA